MEGAAAVTAQTEGSPGAPGEPFCIWKGQAADWQLVLAGDWRAHAAELPEPPAALSAAPQARLAIEAAALSGWDARLASALWRRLAPFDRNRVDLQLGGLPPGLVQILGLALPPAPKGAAPAPPGTPPRRHHRPHWVTAVGSRAHDAGLRTRDTFEFFGQVLLSVGRLLRGRTDMRRADLIWQIDQTGPRSVPIVALVSFLVGLIVAYMGASQLERFGAQAFIADLVTIGVVREIGALLVGIVLAGRVGAAFAAQIGSMRANEEVDALQTMGVDVHDHLVLPRVLALLLVGPLLTAFAAVMGMAAGWLVAVAIFGVTPLEYGYKSLRSLTLPHVAIGLLKGTVYAVLVALAGCRQGLAAGRSAQAVGDATTAAVVQSIVWMVLAASALTVTFQRLQW